MSTELVRHTGSCHCGAVKFQVIAPATLQVIECSCSVCAKKQLQHFIVPAERFKLLNGHDSLTTYTFNTHQAKHTFCRVCGAESFFIPRSNPDGVAIVASYIDSSTIKKVQMMKFDGKNWEEAMKKNPKISDMSKIK